MEWLNKLICNFIGYHYYTVKFTYRDKNNRPVFDFSRTAWTNNKKDMLDTRGLKKLVSSMFKEPHVRRLLCNGTFGCEITAYLGRIKV